MTNDDAMRPRRLPGEPQPGLPEAGHDHPGHEPGFEEPGYGEDDIPDDEFYDDEASAGGEEPLTDDWQDYDANAAPNPAALGDDAPPKKKSYFNTIVIVLAVIVGLFFLYSAVGGHRGPTRINSSNLQNAAQLPGTQSDKNTNAASPFQDTAHPANPNGGLLNDQAALNGLTGKIDNANNAAAANGAQQAPQTAPPAPSSPMTDLPPPATPPIAQPAVQPMAPSNPFMKAQDQTPAAPPMQSPVTDQPPPINARTSNAQLNQLMARLGSDEAKIAALQAQKNGGGGQDALILMGRRLDQMQQVLMQMQAQLQSVAQGGMVSPPVPAPAHKSRPAKNPPVSTPEAVSSMTPLPETVVATPAVNPPSFVEPPKKHVRHAAPQGGAGETSAAHWVLKSAQPGEAYVSPPGGDGMIAVHAGDTFPGLGRVISIDQTNGQWIVRGTQGNITQ